MIGFRLTRKLWRFSTPVRKLYILIYFGTLTYLVIPDEPDEPVCLDRGVFSSSDP